MLYGESKFWFSWTESPEDQLRDFYPDVGFRVTTVVDGQDLLVRCLLRQAPVPCPCSVILRRTAVERAGGFEEGFSNIIEDQAFYAKIMLNERVMVAKERWDLYRQHPQSVSQLAKNAGLVSGARLQYLSWLRSYMKRKGITSGPAWNTVRRAMIKHQHPRLAQILERFQLW
jgi:hypothetical protein